MPPYLTPRRTALVYRGKGLPPALRRAARVLRFCRAGCTLVAAGLAASCQSTAQQAGSPKSLAYHYSCRTQEGHRIHVVTLAAKRWDIRLVKAHDALVGRETVASMAQRSRAAIAINAGFFEMQSHNGGMPSGTLIIQGRVLGLRLKPHDCCIVANNTLIFQRCDNALALQLGSQTLPVTAVNTSATDEDIVLFTAPWGACTRTDTASFQEIAFDEHGRALAFYPHGNNPIPPRGAVVALPKTYALAPEVQRRPKRTITLQQRASMLHAHKPFSAVMGVPLLVHKGAINPQISEGKGDFYTTRLARTAVGTKPNGDIVIVVAEHTWLRQLADLTVGELQALVARYKDAGSALPTNHRLKLQDVGRLARRALIAPDGISGLTIPELAHLFLDLGCTDAINLDGGGSSTLWMQGQVINQTLGDADEALGQHVQRPVGDALVFIPRP